MIVHKRIFLASLLITYLLVLEAKAPRITVVIVVDSLGAQKVEQYKSYFTGGLKMLLDHGVIYERAYYPHGVPETAVGHASLSTGALPKDHGIISNHWYEQNKKISSDSDDNPETAEFAPHGLYKKGKSAHNILVDGLSDRLILTKPKSAAIALSLKSRASICMATHKGKAIWFDTKSGLFTSSRAYFNELPAWVARFNEMSKISQLKNIQWNLVYPRTSSAYYNPFHVYLPYSGDYGIIPQAHLMAGTHITLGGDVPANTSEDYRGCFELFAKSPQGNAALIDVACEAIDEYLERQNVDHLLLWISCSGLDKVSHPYGPDSLEAIDMLYHVDNHLKKLITHTYEKVDKKDALFVLTGDHGLMPLPELMHKAGYRHARRIIAKDLIKKMNTLIKKSHGITDIVSAFKSNHFYLNQAQLAALQSEQQIKVLRQLKHWLEKQPGIKHAWTFHELLHAPYQLNCVDRESFYKYQLRKGRSGELICQPEPYVLIAETGHGTTHVSPYTYDTHVPLILYQTGKYERKRVSSCVFIQQVASTLARMLEIDPPATAWPEPLSGL